MKNLTVKIVIAVLVAVVVFGVYRAYTETKAGNFHSTVAL